MLHQPSAILQASSRPLSKTSVIAANAAFHSRQEQIDCSIDRGKILEAALPVAETVDRSAEIDAAIMRELKRDKQLASGQLHTKVASAVQVRFVLTMSEMQRRVDILISKDYVKPITEAGLVIMLFGCRPVRRPFCLMLS